MYQIVGEQAVVVVREHLDKLLGSGLFDKGARIARLTIDEVHGIAADFVRSVAPFDPTKATEIFAAYPQMLRLEQPKPWCTVETTLTNALVTAILQPHNDTLRHLVAKQYDGETLATVCDLFDLAIEQLQTLPKALQQYLDPALLTDFCNYFRGRLPSEDLSDDCAGEYIENIGDRVLKTWINVLNSHSPETQQLARQLREVSHMLELIHLKAIDLDNVRVPVEHPAH